MRPFSMLGQRFFYLDNDAFSDQVVRRPIDETASEAASLASQYAKVSNSRRRQLCPAPFGDTLRGLSQRCGVVQRLYH